jgi:nucleoprotein TPR
MLTEKKWMLILDDYAKVDLTAARSHKEQFQEISQANEAALAALNTTFDEYKTEKLYKNHYYYTSLYDCVCVQCS